MKGIVGENLTGSVAREYGCAFGTFLKGLGDDKNEKLDVCIGGIPDPAEKCLNEV